MVRIIRSYVEVLVHELSKIGIECDVDVHADGSGRVEIIGDQDRVTDDEINAVLQDIEATSFGMQTGAMENAMMEIMVRGFVKSLIILRPKLEEGKSHLNAVVSKVSVINIGGPDLVQLSIDNKDNPLPGVEGHHLILHFETKYGGAEEYLAKNFGLKVDERIDADHSKMSFQGVSDE